MPFKVVSQFQGVEIYTRRSSPEDTLAYAEKQRAIGATSVRVYDQDWQFISAGDLAGRVGTSGAQRGAAGVTWTVQAQSHSDASPSETDRPARPRVRVFKASKPQEDRG